MSFSISRATSVLFSTALAATMILGGLALSASSAFAVDTTSVSVTSTGALTAGQPNVAPIVVTFTAPTAMPGNADNSSVVRLTGATWVTAPTNYQCGSLVTVSNDQGISANCVPSGNSEVYVQGMASSSTAWPASTTWTVTFAANTVILPNAPTMPVGTGTFVAAQGGADYDSGLSQVALTGYVAPASTVTFDANGGTGAMANQVASAETQLTANVFSRSGFTFAGWNTAADGTGTTYADGASYRFGRSTTLYAQWTAVLAQTGSPSQEILGGAAMLLGVGAGLLSLRLAIRMKARNF